MSLPEGLTALRPPCGYSSFSAVSMLDQLTSVGVDPRQGGVSIPPPHQQSKRDYSVHWLLLEQDLQ